MKKGINMNKFLWGASTSGFQVEGGYNLGGSGATIGLVILMFFKAKSEQYKSFGKLTLPCGIFSVNEPVIFGLPVILNPIMLFLLFFVQLFWFV